MMSSESPPARKPRSRPSADTTTNEGPGLPSSMSLRLLDWTLIAAFLALTFLLGVFPLKDTDFWWHLRTGDLIRATGKVPTHDLYTFTVPDHRWIDLHWGFQVALSWGYAHGGIIALNLAKCVITCVAVFLLISARKRDWPVWAILLAWLPALLVLGGRMYIRPETVSLLYLSGFLAVVFRLDTAPRLAWLLPLIELAWVNTQGLFILGPVVLTFFLFTAVLRPGAFAPERRRWWRTVLLGVVLTGVACFANPYGWVGALYPLDLARTMGNPIFSDHIAELTPVNKFIRRNMGWNNVPLRLHVATMLLGALSFVLPTIWAVAVRFSSQGAGAGGPPPPDTQSSRGRRGKAKAKGSKKAIAVRPASEDASTAWPPRLFRLLLFAAFSALSWQATRNSHQFAAVVGVVTGWNFGEWAAAVRHRNAGRVNRFAGAVMIPRLATLGGIAAVMLAVGSGWFYTQTGEGRTIGLGEEPLWFPHEAVKFAGRAELPERSLLYHDGYAALYEYYNGPDRKVFCDARLEVMGPEQYQRYLDLQRLILSPLPNDDRRWRDELDRMGKPSVVLGHAGSALGGASFLASAHWRCVWFDPIVAVFVHDSYVSAVQAHEVDFAARHFRPDPAGEPHGVPALLATAKALWTYAFSVQERQRADLARPLVLLGLNYARRIQQAEPDGPSGWKLVGQLESVRGARYRDAEPGSPLDAPRAGASRSKVPRYRLPFDPVFDLSSFRSTYAFRRALEAAPGDFLTLLLLSSEFQQGGMDEAALPLLEELLGKAPINPEQAMMQSGAASSLAQVRSRVAAPAPTSWENLSELDRIVSSLLDSGRVGSAADVLERAYPDATRPWEITDRIATLRLHLGEPGRARELWERAAAPPNRAVRDARVAVTRMVEGSFEDARRLYRDALREDPTLFEARYGLAVAEEDSGRAMEALREARAAVKLAPTEVARTAAQVIANESRPFATP